MKKIISVASIFLMASILCFGISSREAKAQNVGSLKDVVTPSFSFNKDLQLGDIDPDVAELQKVLNADPDTIVAIDEIGAKGRENATFGALTKAAVIKFQNKYSDVILAPVGLTVGNGFVGKLTRTRLNLLIGVIDTYDSVGLPQSRVGLSSVTDTSTIVTVASSSPSQMSTCQFVNLLISIGAIAPDKVSLARSATNCSQMSSCQFVDLLINIGAIASNKVSLARSAINCSVNNTNDNTNYSYIYNNSSSGTTNNTSSSSQSNTTGTTQLNVTCTAVPYVSALGQVTKWTVVAAGGTGSYIYSWSGDENLNGTSQTFSRIYSSNGYKNATVRVSSGSLTATANCTTLIGQVGSSSSSSSSVSSSTTSSDGSVSFAGTVIATTPCTGTSNRFEVDIIGDPSPGARLIYSALMPLPPIGSPVLGKADGKTSANDACSAINPAVSIAGFKKIGLMQMFGFGSNTLGGGSGGVTSSGGSGSSSGGSSSGSSGGLTPFSGQVTSVVKCITSYYPYREDSSIRQVLINPCSGSSGESTGYLIIPVADVPSVGQTVLGKYITTSSNCLNPPGSLLGRKVEMEVGSSCQSSN